MVSPIPNSLSIFHCDPVPITEFDDSDLLEESAEAVSSLGSPSLNGQHVPIIRQSVLIASLLEQLCSLYESDKVKSQKLYFMLCNELAKLGIISPVAYLKEFTSVHTQYKQTMYKIIQTSLMSLDSKPAFPNHQDIPAALSTSNAEEGFNLKPITVDPSKVFNFDTSRYRQEFTEKGRIGRGGYGVVFCAQSNIDGQDYAIKKVTLRDSLVNDENEALLREVRILAGLRHKNVVRYHNAWIEHLDENIGANLTHGQSNGSVLDSDVSEIASFPHNPLPHVDSFLLRSSDEESYSFARFEPASADPSAKNGFMFGDNNKQRPSKFWGSSSTSEASMGAHYEETRRAEFSISSHDSGDDDASLFQHSNSSVKDVINFTQKAPESPPKETILTYGVRRDMDMRRVQSFIITKDTHPAAYGEFMKPAGNQSWSDYEHRHAVEKNEVVALSRKKSKVFSGASALQTKLVLYMQMELCQTSLKQWLSLRNRNISLGRENWCEGTSLLIMKQIVSALLFIHSKDLIHRDVKPPNIFLNRLERPHVLLGDFGLAKSDFGPADSTRGYSQSQGLRRRDSHTSGVGTTTYAAPEQLTAETYDSKVDMYSFGIVVFELWNPFGTAMERAQQVKQLRKHVIPSEFNLKHPQVAKLLSSLLDHDPESRPSAEDIFQGDFFEKSKDKIIEDQSEKIKALEKENQELKLLNKKLHRILDSKFPSSLG